MTAPAEAPRDVLETATDWFARRRSGEMTAAEAQALDAWLAEDEAHAEAFAAAGRIWSSSGLDDIREHPGILALRERALNRTARRRWWMVAAPVAAAACIGAVVALPSMLGPGLPTAPELLAPSIQQEFRTSVGQRTTVRLPDGSLVTLDTDTVLRTRETEHRRLIFLDRGQAFFKVAHDKSRPFVVSAGGRTVTATGTAFSVRVAPKVFDVVLVEGSVRVESPVRATPLGLPTGRVQATEMQAGSELTALDARHWTVREADPAADTAWLNGRLVYKAAPLSEVVADMNRYSEKKIVIADAAVADRQLSGTYRAGDIDGFVKAVQDYGLARVTSNDEGEVELAAPEK
ncbi:MAG: FecR family protein [Parcubacteria group bacterium]